MSNKFTGAELFDRYFCVKLNYLHSRNVATIQRYGLRVSGNDEIDRNLDKQEIITEMSISMMFEKFKDGVTVKLVNYNDSAEVYRLIHLHLLAWAEYLESGVNIGAAPLAELVELDRFASVVYSKAVNVFSQQERNIALSTSISGVQELNFHNILTRAKTHDSFMTKVTPNGVEITHVNEISKVKIPNRTAFKDLFTTRLSEINGWSGINGEN